VIAVQSFCLYSDILHRCWGNMKVVRQVTPNYRQMDRYRPMGTADDSSVSLLPGSL